MCVVVLVLERLERSVGGRWRRIARLSIAVMKGKNMLVQYTVREKRYPLEKTLYVIVAAHEYSTRILHRQYVVLILVGGSSNQITFVLHPP